MKQTNENTKGYASADIVGTCLVDLAHKLVKSMTKVGLIAAVISLTACAQQQLDQFNKDLAKFNQAMSGGSAPASRTAATQVGLAQNTDAGQGTQTQLVIPADKTAAASLEAALPVIKKGHCASSMHERRIKCTLVLTIRGCRW